MSSESGFEAWDGTEERPKVVGVTVNAGCALCGEESATHTVHVAWSHEETGERMSDTYPACFQCQKEAWDNGMIEVGS